MYGHTRPLLADDRSAASPGSDLLTPAEAAKRLRLAKQTLARWRVEAKGPAFVRLAGNRVAYRSADVEAWLDGRRFHSTAEADRAM